LIQSQQQLSSHHNIQAEGIYGSARKPAAVWWRAGAMIAAAVQGNHLLDEVEGKLILAHRICKMRPDTLDDILDSHL